MNFKRQRRATIPLIVALVLGVAAAVVGAIAQNLYEVVLGALIVAFAAVLYFATRRSCIN